MIRTDASSTWEPCLMRHVSVSKQALRHPRSQNVQRNSKTSPEDRENRVRQIKISGTSDQANLDHRQDQVRQAHSHQQYLVRPTAQQPSSHETTGRLVETGQCRWRCGSPSRAGYHAVCPFSSNLVPVSVNLVDP